VDAGKVKVGDHVHYVKFVGTVGTMYKVEVMDVMYPGTRHERIRGQTYDVEDDIRVSHEVKHKDYWPNRSGALAHARIMLVHKMQQLQARAMSLGFFLK